jgi:hypothetical protein
MIDVYNDSNEVPDPFKLEAVQDKAANYIDEAYDQLLSTQVMCNTHINS